MLWIAFAFGSAFFAGITAILAKIGIRDVDSTLATALRTIVILLFSWMMVFVVGSQKELGSLSEETIAYLVLSGLCTGASWLCYFKALQRGDVNKVTPIDKSSTALTIVLSFLLLKEPLSLVRLLATVAITVGTLLMITRQKGTQKEKSGWLAYALLSAVFASLTAIFGKLGIASVESNLGTALRTIVVLFLAWGMVFLLGKQADIRTIDGKSWRFLLLSGVTTALSWLCYYRALQEGPASVVVPIDKLSIVVTIVFSSLVLKEHLSKRAFLGLLLILLGTGALLL